MALAQSLSVASADEPWRPIACRTCSGSGHNPAGGLMIIGLLLACAVQVALGLFSSDGVLASGPFADAIGTTWSPRAATLHSIWFYVILGVGVAHIGVNLCHQFVKRDN